MKDFGLDIEAGPHKLTSTIMPKPKFKDSKLQTDQYGFRNTKLTEIPLISNWILVYSANDYQGGRQGNCIDATINSLYDAYKTYT